MSPGGIGHVDIGLPRSDITFDSVLVCPVSPGFCGVARVAVCAKLSPTTLAFAGMEQGQW
jgi:hypothetical protein